MTIAYTKLEQIDEVRGQPLIKAEFVGKVQQVERSNNTRYIVPVYCKRKRKRV